MNCDKTQEYFSAYLEGEISEATRLAVDKHFAGCGPCRSEYAGFAEMWELLGTLGSAPVPANLGQYVSGRLNADLLQKEYPKAFNWGRWLRTWALGGAAVLVAAVGIAKFKGSDIMAAFGFGSHQTQAVAPASLDTCLTMSGEDVSIRFAATGAFHAKIYASVEGQERKLQDTMDFQAGKIENFRTRANAPTVIDVEAGSAQSHFFVPKGDPTEAKTVSGKAADALLALAQRYGVAIQVEGPLPTADLTFDTSTPDALVALKTSEALATVTISRTKNVISIHFR